MADDTVHELEIPEGVMKADTATEVIRAWVADGALHVTFDPETFGANYGEWGRLLSDISQHIAHAASLTGGVSEEKAIEEITRAFERGSGVPEGTRTGQVKTRTKH